MLFMLSLPMNFLRAYLLALRTTIFPKRESVNTKVEDDARALCEERARSLSRHVLGMRWASRTHRTIDMRWGRSGKESRLLPAIATQHLRAVNRQSANSNDCSAEAARELVT